MLLLVKNKDYYYLFIGNKIWFLDLMFMKYVKPSRVKFYHMYGRRRLDVTYFRRYAELKAIHIRHSKWQSKNITGSPNSQCQKLKA